MLRVGLVQPVRAPVHVTDPVSVYGTDRLRADRSPADLGTNRRPDGVPCHLDSHCCSEPDPDLKPDGRSDDCPDSEPDGGTNVRS